MEYQHAIARFFGAIRRAIDTSDWRCADPAAGIAHGRLPRAPEAVQTAHARLAALPLEWREHAAAVVAALQLKSGERERLGAYFTPPYLAAHVLRRLTAHGYDPMRHSIIDPAAGGAAFLAPLHGLISRSLQGGDQRKVLTLLRGIEIDRRLAQVSKDLLAWRVALARGADSPSERDRQAVENCVEVADTLGTVATGKYDVVVGNPPYMRIGREDYRAYVERWPDLTGKGGYLNLSMAFLHHCRSFVKPGGLLSFVMPASMIGGPSFTAFRKSIAGEVIAIDRIENRQRVFLDVIQDCIIVTMRRDVEQRPTVRVGSLTHGGTDRVLGNIKLDREGGRWELPTPDVIATGASLSKLGWAGKSGARRSPQVARTHFEDPRGFVRRVALGGGDTSGRIAGLRPHESQRRWPSRRRRYRAILCYAPTVSGGAADREPKAEASHQCGRRRPQIPGRSGTVRRGKPRDRADAAGRNFDGGAESDGGFAELPRDDRPVRSRLWIGLGFLEYVDVD
ncbi:hypothetical protein ACVWZM_004126 [Bradyrhizobium sp. USDA 4501]